MPHLAQIKCNKCESYFNVPTKPAPATIDQVSREDRTPEFCSECRGSLRESVRDLLHDARQAEEHLDNVPDFADLDHEELWTQYGVDGRGTEGRRFLDLVTELNAACNSVGWVVAELDQMYFRLRGAS